VRNEIGKSDVMIPREEMIDEKKEVSQNDETELQSPAEGPEATEKCRRAMISGMTTSEGREDVNFVVTELSVKNDSIK
jgi:hypothetical protein